MLLRFLARPFIKSSSFLTFCSKNFFIKPVNLLDWPVEHGLGIGFQVDDWERQYPGTVTKFLPWIEAVENLTNIQRPEYYSSAISLFKMSCDIVDTILNYDNLEEFFYKFDYPAEFLWYGFYINEESKRYCLKKLIPPNLTLWSWKSLPNNTRLKVYDLQTHLTSLGIHRSQLTQKNYNQLLLMADWLILKGMDGTVVKNCFLNKQYY